jgi:hypothetical protein
MTTGTLLSPPTTAPAPATLETLLPGVELVFFDDDYPAWLRTDSAPIQWPEVDEIALEVEDGVAR